MPKAIHLQRFPIALLLDEFPGLRQEIRFHGPILAQDTLPMRLCGISRLSSAPVRTASRQARGRGRAGPVIRYAAEALRALPLPLKNAPPIDPSAITGYYRGAANERLG